ncbi:MAG: CRISPR-associated endoribonuclease Cas6 [Bacteroidales bacterium]
MEIAPHISGNLLPVNYQYPLAAWIYSVLAKSDRAFSTWLHENGFFPSLDGGKRFKLFVFSHLCIADAKLTADRLSLLSSQAELYISFLPEISTEKFVKGLFLEKDFSLGDHISRVHFRVQSIEMLAPHVFSEETTFQTLSPVTLSIRNEEGKIVYLSPEDADYGRLLVNNLTEKYKAFHKQPFAGDWSFSFSLLSAPKSKLIAIKAGIPNMTRVRGYLFRFRLKADPALLHILYEAGAGEKGSLGFGMVKPR